MIMASYGRYRTIDQWLTAIKMLSINKKGETRSQLGIALLFISMMKNITGFCVFMKRMFTGMDNRGQLGKQQQEGGKQIPPDA
jgi:hypothetical protein